MQKLRIRTWGLAQIKDRGAVEAGGLRWARSVATSSQRSSGEGAVAGAADQRPRRRLQAGSKLQTGGTKGGGAARSSEVVVEPNGGGSLHGSTRARVGGQLQALQNRSDGGVAGEGQAWYKQASGRERGLCSSNGGAALRRDETRWQVGRSEVGREVYLYSRRAAAARATATTTTTSSNGRRVFSGVGNDAKEGERGEQEGGIDDR